MSSRHKKNNLQVMQAFSMIMQFGINMIVPILLCTMLGVYVGDKCNAPWVTILFFILGAAAGFTSIFKMARGVYDRKDGKASTDVKKGDSDDQDVKKTQ